MTDSELLERVEAERSLVQGWCSSQKAGMLARTILDFRPALCLEIGVFGGSSLIPQALALKHLGQGTVYGIDPWAREAALEEMKEAANVAWWDAIDFEDVYQHCLGHLTRLDLACCCELVRARAADVVRRFADGSVGLLHIDGNHSEALSTQDAEWYLPKVAPGGYIFFDDASWKEQSMVTTHKALTHLLRNGCVLVDGTSDCAVLRKSPFPPSSQGACSSLACHWRASQGWNDHLCHSPKYIAPPNRVALDFCRTCCYRGHAGPGAPPPAPPSMVDCLDPLLPAHPKPAGGRLRDRPSPHLPPIFCITCRQTPERTAQAARHFRECGLDVQFFPGIHGQTFGLRTVFLATPDYRMPAGAVGLVLSHYMLWQTLTFLPHEEILILEDDAWFEPDFAERFRQAYAELPADWQFVYVGHLALTDAPVRRLSAGVGILNYPCGTHGYLVKRSILPFLLRTNHQARTHIDIQIAANSLPHLKTYLFWPSLIRQHSAQGDWPTTATVADNPAIAPTGYWIGMERHAHHFDEPLSAALADLFSGSSVADLGCGNGSYVRALTERGVDCNGYDGNPDTPVLHPGCRVTDLSVPVNLPRGYDWVLSLEVGEHIPALYEDAFIDNLHRHNHKGMVLSWAVPGQGGHGHFNERDNDAIRRKLRGLGYRSDLPTEERLRDAARLPWFKNSLMVFLREIQ